jgi:thioredoxin-like negative regulator of GroEL
VQAFQQYLTQQADSPVAIYFWSSTCPVCRRTSPEVEKARQLAEGVSFAKVELQKARELFEKTSIKATPTLVLFKASEEVARFAGFRNAADIADWIKDHTATQR